MEAVNYSTLRNNLKGYMDRVTDDFETIIVTRKDEKNVIMMSADEYNNLMESIHLLGNDLNRAALEKSLQQLEQGFTVNKPLLDVEDVQ